MNKKIISVFICMLLMGMIPVAVGMDNYKDKIETETDNDMLIPIPIFGLFPEVTENNITFWALAWFTIPKCKFIGHIGDVLIYGMYIMGGPY